MSDEHWATFSIYDHRTSLYKRSLLLFDRIVVPIPTKPYQSFSPNEGNRGGIGQEEIDALTAELDYLKRYDAAVRFDWDPAGFDMWMSHAGEAQARSMNRDPLYATRLQVAEGVSQQLPQGVDSATAVPVYQNPKKFEDNAEALRSQTPDLALLEVVLPKLDMPDDRVSLESIVEFRESAQFRDSLYQLRRWQKKVLPELLANPNEREKNIREASRDFDHWIGQYSEAMAAAKFKKIQTGVVSVFAIGAALTPVAGHVIAALAAMASPVFSIREVMRPSWKIVSEKECAPAAMVYAAQQLR